MSAMHFWAIRNLNTVDRVTKWRSEATILHGESDTAEKADLVALQAEFIAELRTALGI